MPDQYCFVCASNEGVFLDITPDNRDAFGDQIEACLSLEINDTIDLSKKICYKCAYELDQCMKFVQKYKKSHEIVPEAKKAETLKPCCFLCHELVKNDRIFDLAQDNNVLFNPLRKIRSIFNDDIGKNGKLKLICLTCRYNLDVLYDLKRIYHETILNLKALINEEISYSNFPKVHTDVVNRKTTITTFPDITYYGSINSDSESNEEDMARGKRGIRGGRRSNAQTKLRGNTAKVRNCDNCRSKVANDIDMYRFYHTGLTVCKNCWITMDPSEKSQRRTRQIQSNLVETKLCAVFLTDVLSKESCKEKAHEEKNKDNNPSYDSSQEETKSSGSSPRSVSFKTKNHIVNGKARRGRKRLIDMGRPKDNVEHTPLKMTRLTKERANASEMNLTRVLDESEQPSTSSTRKRGRSKVTVNFDSDTSLDQRETRVNKLIDRVNKIKKKRQKFEETVSNSESSDEMSNEDSMSLRTKSTQSSTTPTKSEKDKSTISRTRSSSRSSTEITLSTEFKSPKSPAPSEAKIEYTCDSCNKKFDTKLSIAKHKLTHLKQAALKLEKLTVSTCKEKPEAEVDSHDNKEATSPVECSSIIESSDKHNDDPSSEDIAINVEDDTDEEETLSVSNTKSAKKKMEEKEEEANDEDGDVTDKPDVAKSDSPLDEEPAKDGDIETKESERCEESTVVSDETIEKKVDEDSKDKDIRDEQEHTTKDEDKTSASRNSDNSKDKDAQKTVVAVLEEKNIDEEEDEDIEIENDTEEGKKTISKCNNDNDKDDFQEEITQDSERSRSPILIRKRTNGNKNRSESCEKNLENNCTDDEEKIVKEPDLIQDLTDNLTDESSKKDTKEPGEKVQKILPTDETEALSDKKDSDDIIVNEDKDEELENLHDKSDEENVEVIADTDKLNNVEDAINSDLSNGEKHEEIKDDDEIDVAVPVNSDSNDDRTKHKKVTEETAPANDSKGISQLEKEIKELEELVEDNIVNTKHKEQEDLTCISDGPNSSIDAANEILKEVFELAAAEVQQREENSNAKNLGDIEMETLENISREIRKSADMPSLDPINIMDIDDDNDITLN